MLAKMRAAGLTECVGVAAITLGEFLERERATISCKASTETFYGHTRRNLVDFFGAGKLMRTITTEDADRWSAWLKSNEGLSPATVGRRVVAARTLIAQGHSMEARHSNPFAGIKAGRQTNDCANATFRAPVLDHVIAETPDLEWKVIIALSRYGGLRCVSEHFALKWADIDWHRGEIRVTVPKLAHIEGCGTRMVSLFPELRTPAQVV